MNGLDNLKKLYIVVVCLILFLLFIPLYMVVILSLEIALGVGFFFSWPFAILLTFLLIIKIFKKKKKIQKTQKTHSMSMKEAESQEITRNSLNFPELFNFYITGWVSFRKILAELEVKTLDAASKIQKDLDRLVTAGIVTKQTVAGQSRYRWDINH